ncbi:MAG TPA: translation initiation factor IF-2 [Polyangiaceae bacterium]|nr:translation initiation factor IF-2 [Polyangiaceae bacterium]
MTKLRVYEVARDLGLDNRALVALLQAVGQSDVRNHMSAVAPEAIERVKRQLEKQQSHKVVEERIRPTVVKRRAVQRPGAEAPASAPTHPKPAAAQPASREPAAVPMRAESVGSSPRSAPLPARPPSVVDLPKPAAPRAPPASAPAASAAPVPAPEPAAPPPAPSFEPTPVVTATAAAASSVATPVKAPSPDTDGASASARAAASAPVSSPMITPTVASQPQPAAASSMPEPAPAAPPAPAAQPATTARTPAAPAAPSVQAAAPAVQTPEPPRRPSSPPKTGIDVWEGRPGVPMPQAPRGAPTPRRVQYDAKAGGGLASRGGPRGPMMGGRPGGGGPGGPGGQRGMRHRGIGSLARAKGTGQPVTQERSAHKKVVRIEESIGLQGLAGKIGAKATEVLMKLIRLGMTGVNINSTLDAETAKIVANEFGWEVEDVAVSEEAALVAAQGIDAEPEELGRLHRPPVVTVMGHVDHGKTSLLDRIRKANVVAGEAGGITQHIGAYSVETPRGPITFLDTPGHEAFTAMRARGAQTTDVVILVVSADDGVMPQTREAINHAKAAKVPIVVAINKIDKPDAQPERVRRELSEVGLVPEDWGGDTLFTEVSALTGDGVDNLLEQVALQAELLELRANPNKPASGVVVEAELDRGKGPVATILVTEGTLTRGDVILAGGVYGKVRAMSDSLGRNLNVAGPSTPVFVIGLSDVPNAGDPVHAVKDMKLAEQIASSRKIKERRSLMPSTGGPRMTLEELAQRMKEADQLELKLIIKADVQGSVEAVSDALTRLSTDKVRVTVVHSGAGAITEGDVNLAVAADAIIIGFNVRPAGKAAALAQKETVQIRQYTIIYNVVDEIKAAMEGLLAPTLVEKTIGKAEIRQLFKISKAGMVAGCMVLEGLIRRSAQVRLTRPEEGLLWTGKLSSLKRFKDDVRDVKEGFDCGIALDGYNDLKLGDVIECFEVEEVKQTL